MKHAVNSGNRQEQTSHPVKNFHPSKMLASPPRYEKRSGNMGTWKGCARIFCLCVNKIHDCPEKAVLMIILISQLDRTFNRQKYVDEKTHIEQRGKLEHEAFKEFCILPIQQNPGQGNYQIITKIKEMKKLVEECISPYSTEEKARKFAENPDVQIHKKAINELGYNNPVDQSGMVVQ
jgi:hypothetical protein